ncbi:hypothetical protein [Paenibacillus sp. MMO-177]|uniref:hypothetical protein n=1 Tax=Paenibacillus sp. MMO-177 TaxID=3081289 RepID=UPI0030178129
MTAGSLRTGQAPLITKDDAYRLSLINEAAALSQRLGRKVELANYPLRGINNIFSIRFLS